MTARSLRVVGALLLAAGSACSLDVGPGDREVYEAEMTGSVVQPTLTYNNATSAALAVITIEDNRIFYDVYISNLEGARSATLHIGSETSNTPAVATLWTTSSTAGVTSAGLGVLVQQDRLDSNEITGTTYQQLLDAIRLGNTYVVVSTVAHPDGAFRAQVRPAV